MRSGKAIERGIYMKRFRLSLLLAAALVMILGGAALAATVTFTGDCNVRSAPNIDANSLGVMKSGTILDYMYDSSIDSRGVTWFKVRYNGGAGWVSEKYSYVDDDEGRDEYMWVQVYDDSNVRSAPDLNAQKLGVVYRGTSLDYLFSTFRDDRGVDWYRVSFNGQEGWISSAYTELFP